MSSSRKSKLSRTLSAHSKLIWSLVTIVLAVITIRLVLNFSGGMSARDFLSAFRSADPRYLTGAFLGMLGFIFFEGEAVLCISRSVGWKRRHRQGILYAAADTYFSAITPSATGGQPASAYFMIRDGIPGTTVTAILVFNLIMYTLAAATNGVICILLRPTFFGLFRPLSKLLISIGLLVLLGMSIVFFLVLKKRALLLKITGWLFRFLHRIHLMKNPDVRLAKAQYMIGEYGKAVDMMTGQRKTVCMTYLLNLLQRFSQIMITVCMYMALGGQASKAGDVYVTQSMVVLGSNSVPIPGSMGVTDYLMLDGFLNLMSHEQAVSLELLSRSISFYLCVLLSGVLVLIAYVLSQAKRNRAKGQV